jgi:hypothetical protein
MQELLVSSFAQTGALAKLLTETGLITQEELLISPYFSNYMLTFVGFYSAPPNHVMAPFG